MRAGGRAAREVIERVCLVSASTVSVVLATARRLADQVLGGFCGFNGAGGAGMGAGIFASVATGATPLARQTWVRPTRRPAVR